MKKSVDRLLKIIDNFSNSTILVVGDLMIDHYIYGITSRISLEAPVPIVDVMSEKIFLGGSGNVINNIFEIGGKVFGAGIVGNDDISKIIIKEFENKNIETNGIIIDPTRYTTLKTRIISHDQQVARYDLETKKDSEIKYTKKILKYIGSKINQIDVIIISDYNKGTITKDLLNGILKLISGTKIKIFVDPKRSDLSFYNGVDIITPNHFEAEKSVNLNSLDIKEIGRKILNEMNFKSILITRGEKGMSLFEKNEENIIHTYFPSKVVNVSDVSGAGDTVIGIFSLCVASGANFIEASEISNLAGGIVVAKLGTATLSIEELKESLKNQILEESYGKI